MIKDTTPTTYSGGSSQVLRAEGPTELCPAHLWGREPYTRFGKFQFQQKSQPFQCAAEQSFEVIAMDVR